VRCGQALVDRPFESSYVGDLAAASDRPFFSPAAGGRARPWQLPPIMALLHSPSGI
jgi:hypothetical protein